MSFNRREYRIVLPLMVEEYRNAHLWSIAERSKLESGNGAGVEIVVNEAREADGEEQYTHKIYHALSKLPRFIRMLAPKGSVELKEESWNKQSSCKTIISNPEYMKDKFLVQTDTICLADLGQSENVHNLPPEEWKKTEIVHIDIANDRMSGNDYSEEYDPKFYISQKTKRGPFKENWKDELQSQPHMCVYKLVSANFTYFGMQRRVESMIQKEARRIFATLHRQLVCWMDKWHGMSIEDIRRYEEETKHELDRLRSTGENRGMSIQD